MKIKGFIIITCTLLLVLHNACKTKPNYSNLREVKFSKDVAPILKSNCAYSGCHGDSLNKSIKLMSYNDVINSGTVKANASKESKLYQAITSLNEKYAMPKKPYPSLSEQQIQYILVWIEQGAKNN